MSRRVLTIAVTAFVVAVLVSVAALLPVPYVALSPGPVTDTLGEVSGQELIEIEGHETYPTDGKLDLTTVSVLGGPSRRLQLITALEGWLDDSVAIVPEERVYPEGQTRKQAERQSNAEMRESQENATTAALRLLDIPVTTHTEVLQVPKGSPSKGSLKKGDVITSIDGEAVSGGTELRELITAHEPGEKVRVGFRRDGVEQEAVITTGSAGDGRAIVGILTTDKAEYPFEVDIALENVGGPSAGLMFALGIYDKLTPGSLTGGAHVAGTGTIDDQGKVGAIGGITQKMIGAKEAGASVFLVPAGNCDEAEETAPDDLRIVKATGLPGVVESLDKLRENPDARVPTC